MSKDLTEALRAIMESSPPAAPYAPKERGSAPKEKSAAALPSVKKGSGGGIASPLVETAYADRLYWPDVNLTSTDGMITFVVQGGVKEISFLDANSASVVMQYKQPTP